MRTIAFLYAIATGLLATGIVLPVVAQVTPDGTVNTTVSQSGNNFTINNGDRIGNNLFHSFSQFSVPTNGSAFFNNAADVQNIFSRVTGGSISQIDGLIKANGNANLFLLNPSGILFGSNASLNIGGSFIGTTAESIKFGDGSKFSATDATKPPLLTMSVPIGLQMGQNSGAISVLGQGHRMTNEIIFAPLDRSNNPTGLQVGAGNTLALIGSEVNFTGGIVAIAGGGHLEVGSVSEGEVRLNPTHTGWVGDYSAVKQFNNIHLANQSLLDASGSNGSIQLQGRNINLSEGSAAVMQNFGAQPSGGITVHATESLNLTGNTRDGRLGSYINIQNLGSGRTGDILISASQLSLQNGGVIASAGYTGAAYGNITVNVEGLLELNGFTPANPSIASTMLTITANSSNAGDVTVSTRDLRISNGGTLSSVTFSSGQSGTLRITAKDLIDVAGNNPITLSPSAINTATFGNGNAGNTVITTSKLVIRDGGLLGSNALSKGSAGDVTINSAASVEVSGRAAGSIAPSRIASTAEILDPVFQATYGLPPIPTGNAGALTINTPSLRITDGAFVTVKNDGPGRAGDLLLNANSIFLNNQGGITASTASGNGGNIRLNLQDNLLMRHNSLISATAAGNGNGGNLLINAPVIVGLENSDIIANAVQGRGGNINITTQGIIGLAFRNTLTPRVELTNDITASSQFNVNGTVQINNIGVDPSSGLVELPVELTDPSQQIATGCADTQGSSFVATGRGGIPQNPTQDIRSDRTWSDIRDLSAYRKTGEVTAQRPQSPKTLVQATSWRRNADGKIELIADKLTTQVQQTLTCAGISR